MSAEYPEVLSMALILARQIIILFMIMAGGFILTKTGLVKPSGSKTLSIIIIYLITPCAILNAFQVELSDDVRDGFLLSVVIALIIHGILFLVVPVLSKFFRFSPIEKASVMYSNSGNLIFPLVTAVLGPQWVIYSSGFLCTQSVFVWSHCLSVIEGAPRIDLKKMLRNINIIVVVLGTILFFTGIRLPSIVTDMMSNLSVTLGPLSMVMMGMILAGANWKETFANRRLYLITAIKMLAVPLIILLVLKFSPLASLHPEGQTLLFISLLAVTAPTAASVTQIAQLYEREVKYASAINVTTTIVSIVTMPVIIALYYL